MNESIDIRDAIPQDADRIASIYNHYVLYSIVTFEEDAVTKEEISQRILTTLENGLPYLVIADKGEVVGFSYASKWKGRCAYRFAVETTVYLAPDCGARGLGSLIYTELLKQLSSNGMTTAIGGISLPNEASIALHEKLGFAKVGHFKRVGHKFGKWVDVGYWQKELENEVSE